MSDRIRIYDPTAPGSPQLEVPADDARAYAEELDDLLRRGLDLAAARKRLLEKHPEWTPE